NDPAGRRVGGVPEMRFHAPDGPGRRDFSRSFGRMANAPPCTRDIAAPSRSARRSGSVAERREGHNTCRRLSVRQCLGFKVRTFHDLGYDAIEPELHGETWTDPGVRLRDGGGLSRASLASGNG